MRPQHTQDRSRHMLIRDYSTLELIGLRETVARELRDAGIRLQIVQDEMDRRGLPADTRDCIDVAALNHPHHKGG